MIRQASGNDDGQTELKPMRKGTKSCLECRRRKIKCIYPEEATRSAVSSVNGGMSKRGQIA
ncbi:hypothetical protein LTS07_008851 [Exophiala sideris]|uniref:Zn(2)-C6 fungal-type domain-containing protein n=1 Tax=Exophiala sideris TaxID=1016849 RepID=A0ABR0J281_9EURO|nr:hypothetical protein LTS07_008851 [Exophiala sideris]KAK5054828.1 hypothetical protein LTR69_008736 [Exophiala sideris]